MDGRSNRRNKAAFSDFSGTVHTGPKPFGWRRRCVKLACVPC